MKDHLAAIGVPSSAGAYGPGQEKAPHTVGLLEKLRSHGVATNDLGDVAGFRWHVDKTNARAMHVETIARVAKDTACLVSSALDEGMAVLVLGGDCTIDLGTVVGTIASTANVGFIYVDLDTDLNTPQSTTDGALDWMGVAHMLGMEDAESALVHLGAQVPMLHPEQILFFANDTPPNLNDSLLLGIVWQKFG